MKKKILSLFLSILVLGIFLLFAVGSGESTTTDQGNGTVEESLTDSTKLGKYNIEIKSCRLAKDYDGKDIVIVTYSYTNNSENPAAFTFTFDDSAFQNGIGLPKSYFVSDSANYNSDNQNKEIKKGATLDVEVAYELEDTTSNIEVEVKELISFSDDMVKKTFSLAK